MIERISEEYDERDSNMFRELAATELEYADIIKEMSELKHNQPFIEKLRGGEGKVRRNGQEEDK